MHRAQKKGALLRVPWGSRPGAPGTRALSTPCRPGREGELCGTSVSVETRNFSSFDVIRQHIWQFGHRQPPEPAIGAESELGQILPRRGDPLLEVCHAVDRAEID